MFVIRNVARVKMGRRDEAVALAKEMGAAMTAELGAPPARILTGSVGPSDSTVVIEGEYASLADFEQMLARTNGWPRMGEFMGRLGALMVEGSNRWEIYRLQ